MKKTILLAAMVATFSPAFAAKWGVEADLIQPFIPTVGVYTLNATRETWKIGDEAGELMLGAFLRPLVSHDVVETIDEYLGSVGVRQYFWRGAHAEAKYYAGYVWGKKNKVDGKDYEGFVQFIEVMVGYRFDLVDIGSGQLYVIPQFGVIHGFNPELVIGPRDGKPETFIEGKLMLGYRF